MIEYRTGKPEDLDEICKLVQAAIAHLDAMGIHYMNERRIVNLTPLRGTFDGKGVIRFSEISVNILAYL